MNGSIPPKRSDAGGAALAASSRIQIANTPAATEIALYFLLLFAMLFGGGSIDANWRLLLICMTSAILLPLALLSGGWAAFLRLPLLARLAIAAIPALPLLQLVPLPPDVWIQLPGRELPENIFKLVGAQNDWHPISLAPRNTEMALIFLLPPLSAFFGALTLDDQKRTRCVGVFLGIVVASIFVGLIQLGSRGAALDFYSSGHKGNLLGFFANRNHQGLMIAIAAAFALALVQMKLRNRQGVVAWSVILSLTFIVAAIGTISRAGLGLTVLSLIVINMIYWRRSISAKQLIVILVAAILAIVAVYFLSFSEVVDRAIARFSHVKEDGRWEIWQLSWPMVTQYFPWGSGLGSFVPAYASIEPLDSVTTSYLNHAHNDYLELLIEAGIPGVFVLLLLGGALVARGAALLSGHGRFGAFGKAAALAILLVAIHSIVDYPLRTQSLIVPFAIFLAFFLAETAARKRVRVTTAPE